MGEIKTHKDLKVWQKSIDLVMLVYSLTKQYPKEELYAITNQIRRCVTSIPANIAEGSGRKNKAEFIQFLHISLGSASELETFLIISEKLHYITLEEYNQSSECLIEIIKMTSGLINSLKINNTSAAPRSL
jgi:four helix bundle protein